MSAEHKTTGESMEAPAEMRGGPSDAKSKTASPSKSHSMPKKTSIDNPFIPPSDEQVFSMREAERKHKEEVKIELMQKKVWQKTTSSSLMGKTRRFKDIETIDEKKVGNEETKVSSSHQSAYDKGLVAAATAAIGNEHRREKENMTDFIEKKREMFLVQMALDTKREEIRKLEEKAQMKEEALRKSEIMLEEDAIRFDAFLKENDKKAHDAIKMAETETKAKQDKVMEIKKLNQSIQAVQSDMSKLKEQLEDCLEYKVFLDKLTPPEYIEEQKKVKAKRKQDRLHQKYQNKVDAWKAEKKRIEDEFAEKLRKEEEEVIGPDGKKRRTKKKKEDGPPPAPKIPNKPEFDPTLDTSSGEEIPMYFKRPQTLLDIFTSLEESNLFLIQNSQETEQNLEELRQQFAETKEKMETKTAALVSNIKELETKIVLEEQKASLLRARASQSTGEDEQEKLLKALNDRVREVYKRSKAGSTESNPSTLKMLAGLEAKLENLLASIEKMDPEYVTRGEKDKEQKRRERVRADRMEEQQRIYEERLEKSMKRSQMPVHKKIGKPIMFRSAPAKQKEETKQDDNEGKENEIDELRYFS